MSDSIIAAAGECFGLTPFEAERVLGWGRVMKIRRLVLELGLVSNGHAAMEVAPIKPIYSWCGQCDRRVHVHEADRCRSRFCKAKPVEAVE